MAAAEEKLNEIVRRIIEVAQPLRIVLFGSAARGAATSRSDLDILM
ncbi:MAG: nucleotidyltransferase domain-containing protein [Acidobacteria bacterium]|nr:MAG: nucleotidyltransferase domain-containing protein [Acidobacteriota bacterium]